MLEELKRRNVFRVAVAYAVVAWLVMQVADVILNNIEAPDWIFKALLLMLGIGFALALIFSWAFEITPGGLKREREVDRSRSVTSQTGRKLDRIIIAALAVAVGYFAFDKLTQTTPPAGDENASDSPSIAVLPFVNMSSDADQEYFSDGLSEELLNLLAKIPELKVAARTSAFSYKGTDTRIEQVGQELGVAHVLEGSVRKSGEQVRITAQLIEASDGFHVWSDTYDRRLDDVFAIQDEIAAAVVDQLKVTLLGDAPSVEATDPHAYALCLQARFLERRGSSDAFEAAIELYREAISIDGDYAAAWLGLSGSYNLLAHTADAQATFEELMESSLEAANHAMLLNPDSVSPHVQLARIEWSRQNLAEVARHIARALELDPGNLRVYGVAASLALMMGRYDEALTLAQRSVDRDPVNPFAHRDLAKAAAAGGYMRLAQSAAERAIALSPDAHGFHHMLGVALLVDGQHEAALKAFAADSDEEYRVKGRALATYSLGLEAEHEAAFRELRERWGDRWPSEVAQVYAWIGNADEAFAWLSRSVEQWEDGLLAQPQISLYASLHADPRWADFLEAIGLSPEELSSIDLEVRLPR